jgi:exodeoxyribonuclease VII small subunit
MAKKKQSIEEQLSRLQEIQTQLEGGELRLQTLIELYEEGMNIAKEAHQYLEQAEQKVTLISQAE